MAQVTEKELGRHIDVEQVKDDAQQKWERRQRRRLSLEQWMVRLLPVFLITTFAVFYLLSAPHTYALLDMITPGWGIVAPIGFEMGVVVLAMLRQAGWQNKMNLTMLYALLGVSIVVNTAGGWLAVMTHSGVAEDIQSLTVEGLIAQFGYLPATSQVVLLLVFIVAPLVSFMAKFTGEAVIKLALGHVKLQQRTLENEWVLHRYNVVRGALYNAATGMGAAARTAGKWSTRTAAELYPDDVRREPDGSYTVIATAPQAQLVQEVRPAAQPARTFGFLGYAGQPPDNRTGQDSGALSSNVSFQTNHYEPSAPVISSKDSLDSPNLSGQSEAVLKIAMVTAWLDAHPGAWQDLSDEQISEAIVGHPRGAKTVQRARAKRGYSRR